MLAVGVNLFRRHSKTFQKVLFEIIFYLLLGKGLLHACKPHILLGSIYLQEGVKTGKIYRTEFFFV